jgi:hypothetical protein
MSVELLPNDLTLDYHDFENILKGHCSEVDRRTESAKAVLAERAKMIASKMYPDIDRHTFQRLEKEKHFVRSTLELIDIVQSTMDLFMRAASKTSVDYYSLAIDGERIRSENEFLKETIGIMYKRIDQQDSKFIDAVKKRMNERKINH